MTPAKVQPTAIAWAAPEGVQGSPSIPTDRGAVPRPPTVEAADAADAAVVSDEDIGADTHVVGFEGSRDQIIVVPKKKTVRQWLLGDEKSAMYDHVNEKLMLAQIFFVGGLLSNMGLQVALVCGVEDTRWYWLVVVGGVWLWLVSLPHRIECLVAGAQPQSLPPSAPLVDP